MKQQYLGRRIISIVLTIAMVFSLLSINSMPTYAAEGDPPTITTQPQDVTIPYGYAGAQETYSLTVGASAVDATLTYQWYSNTSKSSSGGLEVNQPGIEPADRYTLNIPTTLTPGYYYYYCVVTATYGSDPETAVSATAVSAVATVKVLDESEMAESVAILDSKNRTITTTQIITSSATYKAQVRPSAADQTVIWDSSVKSVATVEAGVVTPVGVGTTTISVTATNGTTDTADDKYAEFVLQVNPSVSLVSDFNYTGSNVQIISNESSINCWYRVESQIGDTTNPGTWVFCDSTEAFASNALLAKDVGAYTVYYYYDAVNPTPTSETTGTEAGVVAINRAIASVTANDMSKVYGAAEPTLMATTVGAVGGDKLNYTLSRQTGDGVGTYVITVTLGENPNYDVTKTNGTFTITKAPTPAVTAPVKVADFTYDDTSHALATAGSIAGNVGTFSYAVGDNDQTPPTGLWSNTVPSKTDAGNYNIWYKVTCTNYEDVEPTCIGKVSISQVNITVTADANQSKVYGTDDPTFTYKITSGALVGDDTLDGALARTDADNENSEGNDVSKQFAAIPESGTLTITKRNVTLTSADASQTYNGKALTKDEVAVSGDGFVEGEGATYNVTGTQTLVGTSDNAFTYSLNEGTTAGNYVITKEFGTLEVTDRKDEEGEDKKFEITVTAKSDEVLYDGTKKTVSGFETLDFTIDDVAYTVEGITSTVSGVNAGEYETVVTGDPIVKDADGVDVTAQFIVTVNTGKLTINKRKVTLTSASDTMKYDGTALTNDEVTVSEDGFAEGEGASYNVKGSQKVVGSSDNTFEYTLKTGTSADNYIITVVPGTLTITSRSDVAKYQISPKAKSETIKYDGKEHEVTGFVADTYTVEGNTFTVEGLTATAKATDAGEYTVNVTGEPVVKDSDGKVVTDQFVVTPESGTLVIEKRSITFQSSSADQMYDGSALTNTEVLIGGEGFANGEGAEFNVTGTRTLVGVSENTFGYTLTGKAKAENYDITIIYGTLVVNNRNPKFAITLKANGNDEAEAKDRKYDGKEKSVSGYTVVVVKDQKTDEYTAEKANDPIEFILEGNTFTISGMTAGISGTDAGTYTSNVTGMPVIKDVKGNDVSDQFELTAEAGTLVILPREVTLTSASDDKVYDGKPLTNDEVTVSGDGFAEGEGAETNVTGTITLVGETNNIFTYSLNENTSASNYVITKKEGKLEVTNRTEEGENKKFEITLTAKSDEITYDGTEKSVSEFETLDFNIGGVDYTVSGIEVAIAGIDAGSYETEITGTPIVSDAEGNDVSDQFKVNIEKGTLKINKRKVTLTSASDKMKYDGTELKNDEVTVSGDGFVTGEGATFNVTGVQKVVGSSENAFTYELNEGTKEANYDITVVPGTLTVISRSEAAKYQISPEANSDEVKYDGEEHTVSGFVTDTFTVEGNTYTVSGLNAEVKGTDAGEYTVSVTGTAVVKDSDENDVTDQFVVTPKTGTLTINKREVTLTSGTDSKEYDGDPLTNNDVTVSGEGFVGEEGATYEFTGTRTAVGTSENTFKYTLKEGTNADNYNITVAYGTLTVNSRDAKYKVTLTANSDDTLKYSGAEQSVTGFKVNGEDSATFTAENGKTYTISGMSAETKGTDAGEYVVNITGTPLIVDSDGNAVTDQFAMTIESGKMTINKREITVTSATDTKMYDGAALENDDLTFEGDGFVDGEGVEFTVNGSQTLPGESANDFEYVLNEGTNADNYIIATVEGTLTVTEREGDDRYAIEVIANSGDFTYDGTEKEVSGFETLEFEFDGVTYTVEGLSAEAKETNAGTYTVEVTGEAVVKNANGDVLTNNFTVETVDGTLFIDKAVPECTEPEDLGTVYGKTLADIELPEGWTWDDDTTSVGNVGDKEFPATFTPEDTDNYYEVNADSSVTVSSPDKTDLNNAIDEAEKYYNNIKGIADYGNIPAELKEAIDDAKEIAATANVTEEEVSDALTDVDDAFSTAKTDVKKINDDKAAASAVTSTINALPAAGNVKVSDKAKIEAARNAYNNLTADQKARVSSETLKKLSNAEAALAGAQKKEAADSAAANSVTNTINALPAAADITTADKAQIEAARNAYNNLTADQKAKVSAETLKKLTDAEAALKQAEEKASKYSKEWVDGQWYGTNGDMSYKPKAQWKHNSTGWWYEDSSGWYPSNMWQKIDGYWYYFNGSGYMASSEWRDGYWLGADGAWKYQYTGSWKSDDKGWWFEDTSGWYPQNQWQKINGSWYYFGADGYMVTDTTIDGYYIDANGVCQ